METNWTPERIEELSKKLDKYYSQKNYAKEIADKVESLNDLNETVRRSYTLDLSYEEMEVMWKMQTRMETAIMMKIKSFFNMVYGKGNPFCNSLKGKDYLEHYFTFKDFVEGPVYNIILA